MAQRRTMRGPSKKYVSYTQALSGAAKLVSQGKPLRFRQNTKTTKKNTKFVKLGYGVMEKKLAALNNLDEAVPTPIAVGAQAYKYNYALGSTVPPTWSGGFTALNGFTYPQGTANNERDGRYMFLDHTTISMSVHMNAQARLTAPTQFRVIMFRARRVTTPTGISYDPNLRLLLNPSGTPYGPGTAGVNYNDLFLQPTNKRDWIIVCDKRFTLSPFLQDGTTNTAAWQGKYPNYKTMRINLNHKKKTSFQNTTDEPDDYDYHYGCTIIAGSVGRDSIANGWEVNLRGTTTAIDS